MNKKFVSHDRWDLVVRTCILDVDRVIKKNKMDGDHGYSLHSNKDICSKPLAANQRKQNFECLVLTEDIRPKKYSPRSGS
jgi:hypothetical protein